ncbi:MAG: hypothetical protein ACREBD_23175, partial [Blastocatellia bacterium]
MKICGGKQDYDRLAARQLFRALSLIVLLLAIPAMVESQNPSQPQEPRDEAADLTRARELIKLARAAIGGEESLGKIQTITASGKYRRFVRYISVQSPSKIVEKEKALSGKMEFELALPDRFRRRVTGETLRGFGYSFAQIVNGDKAWRDPPLRPMPAYGDRRVIDVSDVERTEFIQATGAKQELTYFSMGWMLHTLPLYPLEMRYAGIVQTDSGPAHAIVALGQTGFSFAILLDVKTFAPTALAISFVENIQQTVIVESAGFFDRRFMQETYARARAERRARAKPPRHCEMFIRFSDRRPVDGVLLPFRVTTSLNGAVIEEMTMNEFEINREINPKKFAGPPKPRD